MVSGSEGFKKGRGIIRAGYGSKRFSMDFQGFSIPPHPLINFEMYHQNKPRFNRVYSRDNLHDKIKYGAYVINLDEYSNIGTH